jgi:predicted RNA methylase
METLFDNKLIDLNEAISLLGVSSATIKNWIRHQYLSPISNVNGKMAFDYIQIAELKEKMASGEINRLNKRANKKHSTNTFIPDEYAGDQKTIELVQYIINESNNHNLDAKAVVTIFALRLFKSKGLIDFPDQFEPSKISYKNDAIKEELTWWLKEISQDFSNDYIELFHLEIPEVSDLLGLLYQSLKAEGSKSQAGSYYTPKVVVDEVVKDCIKENFLVLDPCCGTGQFLLSVAEKVHNPNNIWGFDIDEMAVKIARLNLLLRFPDDNFIPNIYKKNTLIDVNANNLFADNSIPLFDAIVTNPPWGVHFSKEETENLQRIFPKIKSNEAFSYFLHKSLELLKDGGVLSYILPEAILNIKTHSDIRKIITEKTQLRKIKYLSRVFKNVFTPVIRLDLTKGFPVENHKFEAEKEDAIFLVNQSRLLTNHDYIFDIFSNEKDLAIFEKVYSHEHTTLKDNADWALGVVTGDNKKHLLSQKAETNEPILTGKDIRRFVFKDASNFIEFEQNKFQQVAPEYKYRAEEKLLYKFISKELVFSYDDQQTLTLNSANILIPKIENYPVKTILALLNSTLFQFIHQKKFGSLKVLKGDLEKLPLPIISQDEHKQIISLVDMLLKRENGNKRFEIYNNLDSLIMSLFSLTEDETDHIKKSVKVSDKLLNII